MTSVMQTGQAGGTPTAQHYQLGDFNSAQHAYTPAEGNRGDVVATFGSYGTEPGQFRTPVAAAQCPLSGNYIISDMGNNRIQIWSPELRHITTCGEMTMEHGNLKYPADVAVADNGTIYVSDTGNCQVAIFDKFGSFISAFGSKGSGPREFLNPYGLEISPKGLLHVCDGDNLRIQAFKLDGRSVGECGGPEYFHSAPRDIAIYENGALAVTNWTNCVSFFTAEGVYRNTWCGKPGMEVSCASGVAVTPRYDLILVDRVRNEVQICKASKEIKMYGGRGNQPGCFNNPRGALYTRQGHLAVVDSGNDRIQLLDIL